MREIIFDTETTGLNPAGGDRMVEIGCVELYNRCETGRTFHAFFNPGRPMPSEAQAVHGLSDVFLSDKPAFQHLADDVSRGRGASIARAAVMSFWQVRAVRPRLGPVGGRRRCGGWEGLWSCP